MSENKNNGENVVVQKSKTNWGFTLFACLATGIIVFLAMNLGQKASKIVDPNTDSKSSNVTSNESNSNSNVVSNSNETSNVESNINSNMTSNTVKTIANIAGRYEGSLPIKDGSGEDAKALYSLNIKSDGSCSYGRGVSDGGANIYAGTCTLNGNTITLNCTELEGNGGPTPHNEVFTFDLNSDNTINYNEVRGLGNVTLKKTN